MFNHVSLGAADLKKSIKFYDEVMMTLGHGRLFGSENEGFMAYGPEESFFIICQPLDEGKSIQKSFGSHICLSAPSKKHVDEFYKSAIKNGAQCDGAPGIRKEYASDYYAAFILDLDGHKIEAMARA